MSGKTIYTPELGDTICQFIADGVSLRGIEAKEGMPSKASILYWLVRGDSGEQPYATFSDQYARARAAQSEGFMDELLEIADFEIDVQRAKLKIDTRKWAMSKFVSKKYGDKTEITGKDGKDLIPEERSDMETMRRFAFLLSKAAKDKAE